MADGEVVPSDVVAYHAALAGKTRSAYGKMFTLTDEQRRQAEAAVTEPGLLQSWLS
ncbi:hypothetical protein [Paractinoplanes hotanensis]|uniref:Uncharacterized protein n=1 Tax=Paractinoplanes hotanensis TaxID=2906497 RepID=A0ABT0XQR1_9ACTN|nr:hypothetical protein [Actinoplanes hotanensis]MCM4076005.1 hypothetical protein [Actinoplanes hotanensis]